MTQIVSLLKQIIVAASLSDSPSEELWWTFNLRCWCTWRLQIIWSSRNTARRASVLMIWIIISYRLRCVGMVFTSLACLWVWETEYLTFDSVSVNIWLLLSSYKGRVSGRWRQLSYDIFGIAVLQVKTCRCECSVANRAPPAAICPPQQHINYRLGADCRPPALPDADWQFGRGQRRFSSRGPVGIPAKM